MSWRDELRPASFKGVPFHVLNTTEKGSRRIVSNLFPLQDFPQHQDLGAGLVKHKIVGIVIGADYFAARDALRKVIAEGGTGQLVHPFLGTLNVVCLSWEKRETFKEGGMAAFTMNFELTTETKQPKAVTNTKSAVSRESENVIKSVKVDFAEGFTVSGAASFVKENAESVIGEVSSTVEFVTSKKNAIEGAVSSFNLLKSKFENSISSLVQTPFNLAESMMGMLDGVTSTSLSSLFEVDALQKIASFKDSLNAVNTTTPARIQEANNQTAVVNFITRATLAKEAVAVSNVEFDNYAEAAEVREHLAMRIDDEMTKASDAGQEETYTALSKLQVAVVRDLSDRIIDLPRVTAVTPIITEPTLVIANRLYGDNLDVVETMANDVALRNKVKHQGFVLGGTALEVLSNG